MENKLQNPCSLMSVDMQKQDHPLMPECSYKNTINVLITKKCLSLESVSAKVLLCVLHSTVSPLPPLLTPTIISNNYSQILTRNPFPHKPMKKSKSRHTSAAGPFTGTFAPVFFFLFVPFFPQSFLLCLVWCNCSDFLLFSLSLSPSSLNSMFHPWGISWIS